MAAGMQQHEGLRVNLLAFDCTYVRIHVLVLRHTRVMRQDTVQSLEQLGVYRHAE